MGEKGKKIWIAIQGMMTANNYSSEMLAEQATISIDDFMYLSQGHLPADTVLLSMEKALGYEPGSIQKHANGTPLNRLTLLKKEVKRQKRKQLL